ncbi:hypothetical protein EU805_06065 [Salipiger sp. IMCC34102]|uniref:hypothetical protein n=1 Tax=Salipiger sp. IMCC34102 TaxID=2510647 RepID=UPI00101C73A2|nr:hypothetical protein [Salipiger sp. IMCC34102]RYH03284.1 hypothetical protein EU805_06065 [Salipiger sp. IMCC34102]
MIRVAIVGNGPVAKRDQAEIAQAKVIFRFNRVPEANRTESVATTHLVLANSTKQIGTYLTQRAYLADPCFSAARTIVAPHAPQIVAAYMRKPNLLSRLKGRRADWAEACARAAADTGKSFAIWPASLYLTACETLGIDPVPRTMFPSTGFLAVQHARDSYPPETHQIHLYGFGFQGWKRHDWPAEARVLRGWADEGALTLHPVGDPP